ncbi:MAG: hypothetical protein ACODAE_11455 [Gemmatimonadota bacterium]
MHVEPAQVEAARERARRQARAEAPARDQEPRDRVLAEAPAPETLPAFSRLVAASDGHLWIRAFRRPDVEGPDRWTVFDADGRMPATVAVPEGLEVFEIGEDYTLGLAMDALGVQRVRMYRLMGGLEE